MSVEFVLLSQVFDSIQGQYIYHQEAKREIWTVNGCQITGDWTRTIIMILQD